MPLSYDVSGETLHCPVADAVVGSVRTKLIVDTGATEHVLTVDVVDRAELAREPGKVGTDAAGKHVPTWEVRTPRIDVGGTKLVVGTVPAIEGPTPFAAWGIGGFLSPQRLSPDHVVVVDFVQNSLEAYGEEAGSVVGRLRSRYPEAIIVGGQKHQSGTIGVNVAVGSSEVVAIFDSGAAATEIVMAGATGSGDVRRSRSVGGTEMEASTVISATLVAGDAQFSLKALSVVRQVAVPEGSTENEVPAAVIGMDLLSGTLLVVPSRNDEAIWWVVPTTHSALRSGRP